MLMSTNFSKLDHSKLRYKNLRAFMMVTTESYTTIENQVNFYFEIEKNLLMFSTFHYDGNVSNNNGSSFFVIQVG